MYQGRFTWKIEHFTRLKELLKKRKITGMCVKSRCFQVGGRECRLIIYPRGGCRGGAEQTAGHIKHLNVEAQLRCSTR